MALLHDLPECIVGDLTPVDNVSKEEKSQRELVFEALFNYPSYLLYCNISNKRQL